MSKSKNILTSFYSLLESFAKAYKKDRLEGISGISKKAEINPKQLYKKLDSSDDTKELSVSELYLLIKQLEQESRKELLQKFLKPLGFIVVNESDGTNRGNDGEILDHICKIHSALGQVLNELANSREDGIINLNEFEKIKNKSCDLISEIYALEHIIKEMVRASPQQ